LFIDRAELPLSPAIAADRTLHDFLRLLKLHLAGPKVRARYGLALLEKMPPRGIPRRRTLRRRENLR
jgi:hypothetical protein